MLCLMERRTRPLNLAHDLIEQPPPVMPGIADPARKTRQPEFERHPERIRESNSDIKFWLSAKQPDRFPERFSA